MEGVSAEQNEIYLEMVPENISRALKTAQNAKAVKIKLTNKHCPCLTVAVELVSKQTCFQSIVPCVFAGGSHKARLCFPISDVMRQSRPV